MAKIQNFNFKCRNSRCGYEGHRAYHIDEYDKLQYGGDKPGIACFQCGFPKMLTMRSRQMAKDNEFTPGYQRNIGKFCATKSEYQGQIKKMGLIELWYEQLPDSAFDGDNSAPNYWNDETLSKVRAHGIEISDLEAEGLKRDLI